MKTLRFFALVICMLAFGNTAFSQGDSGNKFTIPIDFTWDESYLPIDCIGPYTCVLHGNVTVFHTVKVLTKASGTITGSDGKVYSIESMFNCNNFVRNISASGNSNQAWTFRVRSEDTNKLVATVHMTFHYTDGNADPNFTSVNAQVVCH